MEQNLEKTIKKFNRIYYIELFVIAAIVIVLASLKLAGIIGTSQTSRRVFNIITLVGATYILSDFIWLCFSKKRQRRNCWFDKISLLPLSFYLYSIDIYALINWNAEVVEYWNILLACAFFYVAAAYIAQGLFHIKRPLPSIVEDATEEYNEAIKQAEQKVKEEASKEDKPESK